MSYHSLFSEVLEIIGQIQTLYAAVLCNELHAQVLKGIVECLVLCIATSCVFLFLYYEYIYIDYTPWICAYVSKTLYYIYFWQLDFPLVHVSCYLIFKSGKNSFFFKGICKPSSKTPHIAASRLIIETPRNQIFQQMTIHLSSLRTGLQTFRWRDGMDKKCVQVPEKPEKLQFSRFTNKKESHFWNHFKKEFLKVPLFSGRSPNVVLHAVQQNPPFTAARRCLHEFSREHSAHVEILPRITSWNSKILFFFWVKRTWTKITRIVLYLQTIFKQLNIW